ncbi:hypothetical protein RHGRI_007884 [Rhododendron griersonianum]|uniref:Protein FAR1-RELATED SEQUENCE n=1 Tax=Rhododendron griersonianum TaxID=479676 RepID=A0AAV6KZC8_9ERIC|nr:hypothetical protein RHGRI_007884 [Rhododendron griersonianum]
MLFVCAKEGKYVAKIENNGVVEENEETEEDGKGIPRKRARGCSTVKCGCKAHLLIKYDKWSSKWKVTVFTDAHNHPLVTPSKRMRMKSNRHMPKAVKNLTKAFHKENLGIFKVTSIFGVKSKEHEVKKFEVPLDLQTYMGVCECQNFEFVGILCTHILKVFVRLDIDAIPDHFILPRWRQKANKFRIIDSEGLVHDDGKEESEALRLGHMCQESTKLACLAAPSNEAYMIYIEAMNDLSKKLLKVPKNTPNLNLIVLDPILMI